MSAPKLHPRDAQATGADGPGLRLAAGPRDSISAWLDVLVKLLRLPEGERASVCEELETHLRERTRDLMVTGLAEVEASGRAISELGDMAGLAQRFNRAARPVARRRLMNLGLLAMMGVGVIGGAVALTGPREDRIAVAVFSPQATQEATRAVASPFDVPAGASWTQFFEAAGKSAGLTAIANWSALSALPGGNVTPKDNAFVTGAGLTLPEAVAAINEVLAGMGDRIETDDRIDYRAEDGKLTFATVSYFDRKESVLATYDLAGIIEAKLTDPDPKIRQLLTEDVAAQVAQLLKHLVYPDLWVDNGGELATVATFGTKLFVTAPKRLHPKIRWVLNELPGAGTEVTTAFLQPKTPVSIASIERRQRAAAMRLDAVRQESSQLNAARQQGQVNSAEAARRQAELAEEEADLLDRMSALESQRAAMAGGPLLDAGLRLQDGVIMDASGKPADGAVIELQPKVKASPK